MEDKLTKAPDAEQSDALQQLRELSIRVEGNEVLMIAVAKVIAERFNPKELKPLIRTKIEATIAGDKALKYAFDRLDDFIS